ncbi:MAG TPA: class I SAM-dependent RNA methyltransferase [Anaerolineales bacterium]
MDEFILTLDQFTYGGDCLGRLPDGRAVFVPFTLPGERVRIRLTEEKKGFARGKVLEVLAPSTQRITPRCSHFGECGGCQFQHMPYPLQLAAKAEMLRDQLRRLGKLADPQVEETVASPQEFYYRNQVQFHLSPGGKLGFQAERSHRVVEIKECHLPEAELNELWPQLDLEPLPGLERLGLRKGEGGEAMLVLESSLLEAPELSVEELPVSVVHLSPAGSLVLAGSGDLVLEVLGRQFVVSADSFFQVNTRQAENMVRYLLERLPLGPQVTLLELYSGVGLFSAFLAGRVGRLTAVEESPSACQDFETNLDEFDNVELYEAPVEDTLPALGIHPDVLLADPPRAGLGDRVVQSILKLGPPTLAYISCDPSTLARDARGLVAGGYRLETVTPFDMFPQTYHIESISLWHR